MNKDFCLELRKNQIAEFIESVDKKYEKILTKNLKINDQSAIETTCIDQKNRISSYLFTDTSAWFGNASMEYSKDFLTPKWIKYLEKVFGEEYIKSLSSKIKKEESFKNYRLEKEENTELNSL